jgi:hypothetical protein
MIKERQNDKETATIELDELNSYIDMKNVVLDETSDPLGFWKNNMEKYPKLASFAQDIFVIPASSTPVERIFSKAGYCSSGRRNRLSGVVLENEVLLKTNKQYLSFTN